ncbi:autophagy-related protein 2 homolog A-like [Chamaea fasciata]|uniref:autophagy-related protein 2 homolog A-like n=1 Tax=Chamaea fasciata TaxID=190680 RepID=UPI00336A7875
MTGSLGGGDGAAPPGETPAGSGPPSPAGSPRRRHPSPHSSAPPGRGPPWRGGLRLQVTLGTVTAVLPELGGAPDPAHQHMWAELCDGHAHPALDDALPFPHLRLEVGGAQLGVEPGGPRGGLSLARLELLEELPGAEPHRIQVLRFPAPPTDGPAPTQPVLRLRWGPPGPAPPGAPPLPKAPPPALELGLQLRPLEADLDLGLLERLGPALDALFGHAHGQDAATAEDTRPGHALWAWPLVRWAAPGAELRLWLPLTDLRPTPFRAPPPRLRPESLRVGLGAPRGWAGPVGGALACDCLDVTYEAQDMGTLPVLRAEPGPGPGGACSVPTLEVTVAEAPPRGPPAPPPTPFSARRSIYESHELVLPGTPEELGAFVGGAVGGAPWTLQVTLPRAHLSLSPPELLQRLYNRINNDLLLWDPAGPAFSESPAPSSDHAPSDEPAPSEGTAPSGGPAPFRPCRSALGTDSEEEEEEDEGPGGSPQDLGDTGDLGDPPGPPQSGGAIVVTVPWGRVTADCPPVGGVAGSRLVLELGEGRLCVLPRPGGLRGLSRACVDLRSLILLHGPVPAEGEGPPPPPAPHPGALGRARAPPPAPPPRRGCWRWPWGAP